MSKVIGPLLSLDAKGRLGGSIYYSRYLGGVKVNRNYKKKDAQSEAQLVQRQYFSIARDYWSSLSPAEKQLWNEWIN